jgi:1,4-dihydroxy-6-naphthoate synthase
MFYALAHHKIDTGEFQFEHILRDIETLNRWAFEKKLEVTALSVHAYAHVCNDYALLPHGASVGDQYGPIVVAPQEMTVEILKQKKIGVPGELTTAFLALRLSLGSFSYEVIPFDRIFDAVRNRRVDAGLIIHEGQLTYSSLGFRKVLDLGEWWFETTHLPLPLGVNAVRKDLGASTCGQISNYLRQSIDYALTHRAEALQYARQYGRNTIEELTDRFVGMYVNHFTQNLGDKGLQAIDRLLRISWERGLTPKPAIECFPF